MNNLEEIKKHFDIVDFIGKYIPLKKSGQNYTANCPFHSEKTPSFVISPERQIWHCFGACGEGGDIFKFLMKWENLTFPESVKELAKTAGIKLDQYDFQDKTFEQKQLIHTINEVASDFYHYLLQKHKFGKEGKEYLKLRKINEKIQEHFYLGYAPNSWNSLLKFLNKKGYQNSQIIQTGLIIQGKNNTYYDRFRGRLIFPLFDTQNNIVGFSGRTLVINPKEAKYINTPETVTYHKREHLFGINLAKENIKQKKEVILVEGEFDAIMCHSEGFSQAVAIKGSALTEDHLKMIKRLTDHLIFALDMDLAGNEAAKKGIQLAEKYEFKMEVIEFTGGKDPADILKDNPEEFKQFYKQKVTVYDFLINNAIRKHNKNDVYEQKKIIEEVLVFIKNIYNPVIKEHFLKKLAEKSDVSLEVVKKSLLEIDRLPYKRNSSASDIQVLKPKNRSDILEDYLIALMLQTGKSKLVIEMVNQELQEADFLKIATFKLIKLTETVSSSKNTENLVKELTKVIPAELLELLNRGMMFPIFDKIENIQKEITKTVLELKKMSLKKNLKKENNSDHYPKLLNELKGVEKKLSML